MVTSTGKSASSICKRRDVGAAFRKSHMPKALVIVESPAKAKTINKYLGKQYVVKASLGHIKDLPKNDLAVDVEHGFEPRYEVIEGKKKLIAELKASRQKGGRNLPRGRPGSRRRSHLLSPAGRTGRPARSGPQIFRVMFNEITKKAIEKAFETPRPGEHQPGGCAAGAPRAGSPGGLQDLSAAVGQGAPRPFRRPRADRRAARDRGA